MTQSYAAWCKAMKTTASGSRARRPLRFTLRAVLLAMLICCVFFAGRASTSPKIWRLQQRVDDLERSAEESYADAQRVADDFFKQQKRAQSATNQLDPGAARSGPTQPNAASESNEPITLHASVYGSQLKIAVRIRRGVQVYAHSPENELWTHVSTKLRIKDANGSPVNADVVYPRGEQITVGPFGTVRVYRDSISIKAQLKESDVEHPLTVSLESSAWDRLHSYCLGTIKVRSKAKYDRRH